MLSTIVSGSGQAACVAASYTSVHDHATFWGYATQRRLVRPQCTKMSLFFEPLVHWRSSPLPLGHLLGVHLPRCLQWSVVEVSRALADPHRRWLIALPLP